METHTECRHEHGRPASKLDLGKTSKGQYLFMDSLHLLFSRMLQQVTRDPGPVLEELLTEGRKTG